MPTKMMNSDGKWRKHNKYEKQRSCPFGTIINKNTPKQLTVPAELMPVSKSGTRTFFENYIKIWKINKILAEASWLLIFLNFFTFLHVKENLK